VTNLFSYQNVIYWLNEIYFYAFEIGTPIMIVGNKCDLEYERRVSHEDVKELVKELSIHLELMLMETSAKYSTNVNMVFEELAKKTKEVQDEQER